MKLLFVYLLAEVEEIQNLGFGIGKEESKKEQNLTLIHSTRVTISLNILFTFYFA